MDAQKTRYEFIDPTNGDYGTAYTAKTKAEIIEKAEQVGASRFNEIGPDDTKTAHVKVDGEWQLASEVERKQKAREACHPNAAADEVADAHRHGNRRDACESDREAPAPAAVGAECQNAEPDQPGAGALAAERRVIVGPPGRVAVHQLGHCVAHVVQLVEDQ